MVELVLNLLMYKLGLTFSSCFELTGCSDDSSGFPARETCEAALNKKHLKCSLNDNDANKNTSQCPLQRFRTADYFSPTADCITSYSGHPLLHPVICVDFMYFFSKPASSGIHMWFLQSLGEDRMAGWVWATFRPEDHLLLRWTHLLHVRTGCGQKNKLRRRPWSPELIPSRKRRKTAMKTGSVQAFKVNCSTTYPAVPL